MDDDRHARRFQALAESGVLFAEATTDLSRLLNLVARRFSDLLGDGCNLRLIEGEQLVPMATSHPDPHTERYLREFHDATPLQVGVGISGQVLETGEPYFEPELDLEAFSRRTTPAFATVFRKTGITGMIVVRLRARGINLGYLGLFRTTPGRRYTLADLHLVRDLADRAALAIDNARLVEGLERRVAERTYELETANRELEAFAYSVSHDLRSPLRAIEGFSKVLEEDHGTALDADAQRTIGVIRKNTRRMSQLIDSVVANLNLTEARPVEVRIAELPPARGNVDLLHQVWINLLSNAVKYSRKKPQTIVEISGTAEAGEVRYTVTDRGAGFDPKLADKLFGVFQRLHSDADFEGTGVGLALVQRIVARHGGRVWADGRLGEGATFGFALPDRR
ncbi:MAG: GAF domain-containing protein [Deltaproteobacteria bacterium]|nr:GAF domain-containing protein [Deltaproteobacteria bacterium]